MMKAHANKKLKQVKGAPGDKHMCKCIPRHYFSLESILKGGFGIFKLSIEDREEHKPVYEQSGRKM